MKALLLIFLILMPVWAQPNQIPAQQIESIRELEDPFFLDVRTAEEIRTLGSLSGYYNIPVDELEQRLDELPKDRLILTA
jgi:rhodanese-related sulfurtransferase